MSKQRPVPPPPPPEGERPRRRHRRGFGRLLFRIILLAIVVIALMLGWQYYKEQSFRGILGHDTGLTDSVVMEKLQSIGQLRDEQGNGASGSDILICVLADLMIILIRHDGTRDLQQLWLLGDVLPAQSLDLRYAERRKRQQSRKPILRGGDGSYEYLDFIRVKER